MDEGVGGKEEVGVGCDGSEKGGVRVWRASIALSTLCFEAVL